MTDTSTLLPCPHLEPCPWCGCALYAVWRRANPHAACKTEGCFGRKMAVVNLDDPSDVAAWNRRAPAPAPTDAEIDAIADQHKASGYGTVWPHAFARAILAKWGTPAPVSQPVATPAGMEPYQRSADGTDVPPELASTARPTSIAAAEVAAAEVAAAPKGGQHAE